MKELSSKTILIIGAGLLQCPIIRTAKEMGLFVVAADMNPNAPGFEYADHKILMSTKDIEGMVREAKYYSEHNPIHGVVTAGTDASMTVAAVANALELPGIRFHDAEAATNKIKMRKRLKAHNVPIPNFHEVWTIQDARDALEFLKFPLVMKPADNMGARGVIKVNNRDELQMAFKHAKKYSPTGELILEEYMSGPELSIDAITFDGKFFMTGIADRIIEREPYFIEIGHTMPSNQPEAVLEEATQVMIAGMKALGITLGAGKGDIKVTPNGVKVGEIAARLSGGFMSAYTFPLSTGINLNRIAILLALGEKPSDEDFIPKFHKVSIERALFAKSGKILSIEGVEEAKKIPHVNEIFIHSKVGDEVHEPTNNIEKSGHVIITCDTLEEAEKTFLQVQNTIQFITDDLYTINEKQIAQNARLKFGKEICWVCKVCDGADCASGVPGMGGVGRMETFQDNIRSLREYSILPSYIRENAEPNTEFSFLGKTFAHPIMAAPMTGATTNMNDAITEYEYALTVLKASIQAGTIAWLGDGATPNKYLTMLDALKQVDGMGILICKPRADEGLIRERFQEAESQGVFALGMDIDAFQFKTLIQKNQQAPSRTLKDLSRIRSFTKLPFIIKGVLTVQDAELAIDAGADCIVVSNHGGRILDDMPGTARVLPQIAERVNNKTVVLADGGIRSGMDVFKMLALGASGVLVGRPIAIFAVGGGVSGVRYLYNQYLTELRNSMNITGANNLKAIHREMLFRK